MVRSGASVALFFVGLLLFVLGFAVLSSHGGQTLCAFPNASVLREVFDGRCGGISMLGGSVLVMCGVVSLFVSRRLQKRR